MNLEPVVNTLSNWTSHTIRYYKELLCIRSIRLLLYSLTFLVFLSVVVVSWAAIPTSITKWVIGDVIQQDYITGSNTEHYQFIRLEDAVESTHRFKLNMPQTLVEYIEDVSLFKMEDGLQYALGGEFIKQDEIVLWTESENNDVMDKVGQFIDNRPPKVEVE